MTLARSWGFLATAAVGVVEERISVALGVGVVVALQGWWIVQMHVRRGNACKRKDGKSFAEHAERFEL